MSNRDQRWRRGDPRARGAGLLTRRARRHDVLPYGAFLCGTALVALAL